MVIDRETEREGGGHLRQVIETWKTSFSEMKIKTCNSRGGSHLSVEGRKEI